MPSPRRLHRELRLLYGARRTLLRCTGWQLVGLFSGALEICLVFYLFDAPMGVGAALVMESLGRLARSAAFMLPGGLGAQEAAFAVAGQLIGIGPQAGLALAFAKRFRELVFGSRRTIGRI